MKQTTGVLAVVVFVWAILQSPIVAIVAAVSGFFLFPIVAKWALKNNANPRKLVIIPIEREEP